MSHFKTATETRNLMKAIEIAESNGCLVFGTYTLSATEIVISGNYKGHGGFFYVGIFSYTFREATECEYEAATNTSLTAA